jgi:hypothetical protein
VKKTIQILALLGCLRSIGAVAQQVQNEGLVHTLGPQWTSMYEISRDLRYDAIELVPVGSTFQNWKEVVTISDFLGESALTAEDTLRQHQAIRERHCPGAVHWTVLSRDATGVVFQWHIGPCNGLPEEDSVGRVIVGRYGCYLLEYAARVHELAPETRAQWLRTFSDATFDSVTLSFDAGWMSVDVDETVPFPADKVAAAAKAAMEAQGCKVTAATADRIECKRGRVWVAKRNEYDYGGESVTAVLEAKGDQTKVHITTGLGVYGRLSKRNWSTPVYEAMMKTLRGGENAGWNGGE